MKGHNRPMGTSKKKAVRLGSWARYCQLFDCKFQKASLHFVSSGKMIDLEKDIR